MSHAVQRDALDFSKSTTHSGGESGRLVHPPAPPELPNRIRGGLVVTAQDWDRDGHFNAELEVVWFQPDTLLLEMRFLDRYRQELVRDSRDEVTRLQTQVGLNPLPSRVRMESPHIGRIVEVIGGPHRPFYGKTELRVPGGLVKPARYVGLEVCESLADRRHGSTMAPHADSRVYIERRKRRLCLGAQAGRSAVALLVSRGWIERRIAQISRASAWKWRDESDCEALFRLYFNLLGGLDTPLITDDPEVTDE